jgi:tRNA (mo5U34)-methyltransferase
MADAVPWWHSIELGKGVTTKGHKTREVLELELQWLRLPNLQGKSVLDIGAWDGYFSFAAERLGAARMVALDHYAWSVDIAGWNHYSEECRKKGKKPGPHSAVPEIWQPDTLPGKRAFDTACLALNSDVESIAVDFMEADLGELGTFDVVLYLGVLYHIQNPFEALKRLAAVTKELAIIETVAVFLPGLKHRGFCEFFEMDELQGDVTNWWAPSKKALEGMCRAAGFKRAEVLTPNPGYTIWKRLQREPVHYRVVAHAWK